MAEEIVTSFATCPIPEIARPECALKQRKDAFLAYFTTSRANNVDTEAISGLIELYRRVARGLRNRAN